MLMSFDFLGWGVASLAAVGLASAAFMFLLGRIILGRGGQAALDQASWMNEGVRRSPFAPGPASDPFLEGPAKERRCHFRRAGNPTYVAIGHPEDPYELARGTVLDRSTGGICLELPTPLAVGAIISVRPSVGSLLGTWVEAEVRHCRRDRYAWRVGLKFVRNPPLSVLWMFG
jgi:hypothetical protein